VLKLMRKSLKKHGVAPEHWISDKLASYGAALRPLRASRRHLTGGRPEQLEMPVARPRPHPAQPVRPRSASRSSTLR
jgi:transposase-like protein